MKYLKIYLAALLGFLVLDGIWLGFVAQEIYFQTLGSFMAETPDWLAAAIFYPFFILGLLYLVIIPHLGSPGLEVLKRGAAYGAITYATYQLTQLARQIIDIRLQFCKGTIAKI
ncbi:MAG: DUF2177 family protein [Bacteroidota bacterium]